MAYYRQVISDNASTQLWIVFLPKKVNMLDNWPFLTRQSSKLDFFLFVTKNTVWRSWDRLQKNVWQSLAAAFKFKHMPTLTFIYIYTKIVYMELVSDINSGSAAASSMNLSSVLKRGVLLWGKMRNGPPVKRSPCFRQPYILTNWKSQKRYPSFSMFFSILIAPNFSISWIVVADLLALQWINDMPSCCSQETQITHEGPI